MTANVENITTTPPESPLDVDKIIDERRLQILRLFMMTTGIMMIVIVSTRIETLLERQPRLLIISTALVIIFSIFLIFRRIPYRIQATFLCLAMVAATSSGLAQNGLIVLGIFPLMITILVCFSLLGVRFGTVLALFAAVAIIVVGIMASTGRITISDPLTLVGQGEWLNLTLRFGFFAIMVFFIGASLVNVINQALNDQYRLTEQLSRDRSQLLDRVEESTRALTLTADISRQLTTILDTEPLLESIIGQIQSMFGYYHVQIYLVDPETNLLILRSATGQASVSQTVSIGQRTIPYDIGLVGIAASRGESILVKDISTSKIWIPNPQLPKTQSEVAIPIIMSDAVVGVLNVHHHQQNGLTEIDVSTLEAVTLQLATALTNAQLFEEAFRQANHQAQINRITQRLEAATDVYALVQVAAREIGQALGVQTKVQLNLEALQKHTGVSEVEV